MSSSIWNYPWNTVTYFIVLHTEKINNSDEDQYLSEEARNFQSEGKNKCVALKYSCF